LHTQEQKRVMVLNRLVVGQLTAAEVAVLLNRSDRQVRRLCAAYRKEGAAALAHGKRGGKPVRTISEEVGRQVIELATTTSAGCNVQHLRDLLAERDGIELSRTRVRRIRLPAGIGSPKQQRRRQQRRRRARYAQEGMLVQIDGSRQAWLEERGPWLTLIAAIDDATGKLAAAVFREEEDAAGYFVLVQQLLEQHGRPLALYHDRQSIFKQTSTATEAETLEEQLAGKQDSTQFGRLLEELEITSSAARSPQAKGRVERLFGTLQERLVVHLRLCEVRTVEEANRVLASYVPRFNAQFAVTAAQEGSAYLPLQETLHSAAIFCFKYQRIVAADNTISFAKQRLQLLPDAQRRSSARARVQVHEHFDGHLSVQLAGRCVATTQAPLEAPKARTRSGPRGGTDVSLDAQTPPSAVVLLTQASTAEGGVSEVCQTDQSAVAGKPAATHPWRKPWVNPQRTESLDNNSVLWLHCRRKSFTHEKKATGFSGSFL
jgi:transposase